MRSIFFLALLTACAPSFPAVKPTPGGTLLEIVNVPVGMNCYPVRGYLRERGEICVQRLRTMLDGMMAKMLDRHLAKKDYRARLELEQVGVSTAPDNPNRFDKRSAAYHFTLHGPNGEALLDVRNLIVEQVPALHHGVARPMPEEMVQAPELYQPGVLYEMFFDMIAELAYKIDGIKA
jgi:hypothetical protein